MSPPSTRRAGRALVCFALALALPSCGGDSPAAPDPDPDPSGCNGAQDLSTCLPSWSTYSEPQAEQAPELASESTPREEEAELQRIDTLGNVVSLGNVTFVCTDRTYTLVDNPDRVMSFNIDQTEIWPGALIQGKTHRDGASIGALQELTIRERAPLSVTLSFNNDDNTRVVENPEYGSVSAAVGSMIGGAEAEGLATANNIDYLARSYASEKQAAYEFGMSGRYLAFEATASGSLTRHQSRNTVAAKFVQQMYIAGVTQPSTPSAFFSEAFTPARYQQHAAAGNIGPANPPLYVSRIGYGRMMVFAMSAQADASEIEGALSVSYNGIVAGGSASLNARQKKILETAEIRITQVGGDQTNALNAIRTGRLADYFTDRAPLTSAAPLWFELKTLSGQVALVSEAGSYTETTCVPRLPGTFDYQPEVQLSIQFEASQRQTVAADVNDDGHMDLVFNERRSAPSLNRVHVALGQQGGGFTLATPADNPNAPAEGWENYRMLVADIDGDGRDDLVWNHTNQLNVVYSGMSDGNGGFTWRDRQVHASGGWGPYTVTTGDMNGDGKTDLVWSNRFSSSILRTYIGFALPDSSFSMITNYIDRAGNYSGYAPMVVGRFNQDPYADVLVSAISSTYNNTYIGRFTPTSPTANTGSLAWALHSRGGGWGNYRLLAGDIDGVNAMDLIWLRVDADRTVLHRAFNNGSGAFSNAPTYNSAALGGTGTLPYLGDFNDDGKIDMLLNRRTETTNDLIVGYGTASGDFSFPAGPQTHPQLPTVGWGPFDQVFTGDVDGDGKEDVVWTTTSSDVRIFVALAQ